MPDSSNKVSTRDIIVGLLMVVMTGLFGAGGSAAFGVNKAEVVRIETKLDVALKEYDTQKAAILQLNSESRKQAAEIAVLKQRVDQLEKRSEDK